MVATASLCRRFAAGIAPAQSPTGQDLMKKNGCAACHAEDKKIVGPSYQEVAAKYKGDPDALPSSPRK